MMGLRHLPGVSTLRLDEAACTGCGACTQVCPHAVLAVESGRCRIADLDACMECGACVVNCPAGALSARPGVGCASAIISSWFRRSGEVSC
jgi:NAD-dependent dihydropyrimidine dehydrogenase PreA subunit